MSVRNPNIWESGSGRPGGLMSEGHAGHIPSAIHQPIDGLYDERGSFRPIRDLRSIFSSIDLEDDGELTIYGTVGGRAATAWFVLTYLLGREQVRVYDGIGGRMGSHCPKPGSSRPSAVKKVKRRLNCEPPER